MKYKSLIVLALLAVMCVSCRKDHYNTSNVNGVKAEGEVLLPVSSTSFTFMEMMQKFKIDSIIHCSEDGNLSYDFHYEDLGVINGNKLLRFKDLDYSERFSIENPFSVVLPHAFDTMFHFEQSIVFQADHISVLEAMMKSGHLDFELSSNIGALQRLVIRTSDIKDADGQDLQLDFQFNAGTIGFDLTDLRYETESANTLNLEYDLYVRVQELLEPELYLDMNIRGRELAFREMRGFVETYDSRNYMDTVFRLFPDKVAGSLEVHGAKLSLEERNTFGLAARMIVDTAWIYDDDMAPFSVFSSMPLSIEVPMQTEFGKVYETPVSGIIKAKGGKILTASSFIVNPMGLDEEVSVSDTCTIDVKVDATIPFAFTANDVRYVDTVELGHSETDSFDVIDEMALELTVVSTIPLNMNAAFYIYDSESERVTDTLTTGESLIGASYDGQPVSFTFALSLTRKGLENFMASDHLIMMYEIDTDAREVHLNASQKLEMYLKARVKYNGVVTF
jgi:hypothetical protein